jgi:mRNA-degrading endonuclease RelE of RelBE toxin-antitoxin system
VTLDHAEFTAEAREEFRNLPRSLQRQLRDLIPYLIQTPYRSYPWLKLKEQLGLPGVWRFRLGPKRVFYTVDGSVLLLIAIAPRPSAYTASARKELHRRLQSRRHSEEESSP